MSSTKLFHYSVICHKALNIVSDNARALPINNMSALSGGKISLSQYWVYFGLCEMAIIEHKLKFFAKSEIDKM